MPDFEIGPVDFAILVVYLIATRVIGFWVGRGKSDSDDYFLGGRSFIWPLIGFFLFATNQSGASFVGLAGSGYNQGIAVYNFEWLAAVALIFFILFLLPFYLRSEVHTMPQFLEVRYGVGTAIRERAQIIPIGRPPPGTRSGSDPSGRVCASSCTLRAPGT